MKSLQKSFILVFFICGLLIFPYILKADDIILKEEDIKSFILMETIEGSANIAIKSGDDKEFQTKIVIDVLKQLKNVWNVKVVIPVPKCINKGDNLDLTFFARGKAENGDPRLKVELNTPNAFIKRYNLRKRFKKYNIKFMLTKDYSKSKRILLEFVVGHKKQKVEIGGLSLKKISKGEGSVNRKNNSAGKDDESGKMP